LISAPSVASTRYGPFFLTVVIGMSFAIIELL
jgi:hypothetical protein